MLNFAQDGRSDLITFTGYGYDVEAFGYCFYYGYKFADHKYITRMLHTKVHFVRLCSSRERGLVENTDRFIRQYHQ